MSRQKSRVVRTLLLLLVGTCRWVEQDPLVIWESVRTAIQRTMDQAAERHGPVVVKAVGITNQSEAGCC